jgi:hypothetical protein
MLAENCAAKDCTRLADDETMVLCAALAALAQQQPEAAQTGSAMAAAERKVA